MNQFLVIYAPILYLKKKLSTVLAFLICSIVRNIFQVVPYQEVNVGTASFSCKRRLKSIAQLPIFIFPKLCQIVILNTFKFVA